jgi:hypothetical protein
MIKIDMATAIHVSSNTPIMDRRTKSSMYDMTSILTPQALRFGRFELFETPLRRIHRSLRAVCRLTKDDILPVVGCGAGTFFETILDA